MLPCTVPIMQVHQSITKKPLQLMDGLINLAYHRDLQKRSPGGNNTAGMNLVMPLMQYIQQIYALEYLTILDVNATILFTVNGKG